MVVSQLFRNLRPNCPESGFLLPMTALSLVSLKTGPFVVALFQLHLRLQGYPHNLLRIKQLPPGRLPLIGHLLQQAYVPNRPVIEHRVRNVHLLLYAHRALLPRPLKRRHQLYDARLQTTVLAQRMQLLGSLLSLVQQMPSPTGHLRQQQ